MASPQPLVQETVTTPISEKDVEEQMIYFTVAPWIVSVYFPGKPLQELNKKTRLPKYINK